jgi:Protein of unknown function (DUF3987)
MTQTTVEIMPLSEQEVEALSAYLQSLQDTGEVQTDRQDFGEYEVAVKNIEETAIKSKGNRRAIETAIKALKIRELVDSRLAAIRKKQEKKTDNPELEITRPETLMPPLPAGIAFSPEMSRGACKWLDEYTSFSRKWSPRGYEHFHTACGVWGLSSIAARRVRCPFGPRGEYTALFIALVALTTQHRKTTTAEIVKDLLRSIGLSWLLCPDIITPQKLLSNMAGRLPKNYEELSEPEKEIARMRYGMSGQLGWFYDEFGQHLDAMTAKNGIMADFKGLLRRFDDFDEETSSDTISRDLERVEKPYMALLASMTPADIRPYAGKDAKFWKDGFFARFAFITPPLDDRNRERFPSGDMEIPASLKIPLRNWHQRLGVPQVKVTPQTNKKGDITGYEIVRGELPCHSYPLAPEVFDAFYSYNDALEDLVLQHRLEQLAGNYGRMAKKALRLALLFASLDNSESITIRHWAKAQEIVETWRESLHELYSQVNTSEENDQDTLESEILAAIEKQEDPVSARDLRVSSRKFREQTSADKFRATLESLATDGAIERFAKGRAVTYTAKNKQGGKK